jgi:hypothetical protein
LIEVIFCRRRTKNGQLSDHFGTLFIFLVYAFGKR